jgi:transmembrane sensor
VIRPAHGSSKSNFPPGTPRVQQRIDWDLLVGYLSGECTREERVRAARLLAGDHFHRQVLEAITAGAQQVASPRLAVQRVPQRSVWPVAACLLAIVGGALLFALLRSLEWWVKPSIVSRSFETHAAERAQISMPDGSAIVLGPVSTLRYTITSGRHPSADVALTGEATFAVVHDETRPFRVRAGGAVVTDMGTRFGIQAYDSLTARIVVAEGTVAVGPTKRSPWRSRADSTLHSNDAATVSGGKLRVVHGVDPERELAWSKGELAFVDTPIDDAIPMLNRWFDLEIKIGDPALHSRKLTATYHDDPITTVIGQLESALQAKAVRDGRKVTLYGASP